MTKKDSATSTDLVNNCYLPDFCRSETNLRLILVLELIAIVLALSSAPSTSGLFIHLALISVYIQWVGLSTAAVLCLLSGMKVLNSTLKATTISLLILMLITVALTYLAINLNAVLQLGFFNQHSTLAVILYHAAISLILYGLALRYFFVQYTGNKVIKAESHSRLQALQARIRPHFLFNSLNTIASLTHDEPDKAERAIEDLAELFRASLNTEPRISLQDEIELTEDYINLELLRLDQRLKVNWVIETEYDGILIPALILQPLVENAIYHGIEPLQEGGEVTILIKKDQYLCIEISNPWNKSGGAQRRQGNQMALQNISERLQLAFHGEAKFEHLVENDLYKVNIRLPITDKTTDISSDNEKNDQ